MTVTELEYYHIAEIQIDTAIDLFNESNFICAITLAAAGEEILGKLLPPFEEKAMDKLAKSVLSLAPELSDKEIKDNYLNLVKNGFKHIVNALCEQDIDIKLQAIQYIARACTNYISLRADLTKKMRAFSDAHPGN